MLQVTGCISLHGGLTNPGRALAAITLGKHYTSVSASVSFFVFCFMLLIHGR